jgi:hypothetical protein
LTSTIIEVAGVNGIACVSIIGKIVSKIAGTLEGPRGVGTDLVTVVNVLSTFIYVWAGSSITTEAITTVTATGE